ncbi:hypothetical protein ACM46_18955 [Chryseobacterium angstadtii]|uniref:Uncharacterized protein n=1 Tax=Chryseobacterium angstadtii TaxID=558151 RepID=A0A0J7I2V9_9FLAO|nr:hypothetical protein ACM46_18955 [Chryseobacterium angstadtii]
MKFTHDEVNLKEFLKFREQKNHQVNFNIIERIDLKLLIRAIFLRNRTQFEKTLLHINIHKEKTVP